MTTTSKFPTIRVYPALSHSPLSPSEDLHSLCSSGAAQENPHIKASIGEGKKTPLPLFSLVLASPKEGAQRWGWHSLLEQDRDTCAGLGTAQCSEIRESSSAGRDGCKETTHSTHRARQWHGPARGTGYVFPMVWEQCEYFLTHCW